MLYLKIAFHFFRKNILLTIILVLQLATTVILVNFLIGKYNALSDVLKITANFSGSDTYMYMPAAAAYEGKSRSSKLEAILEDYAAELIFEQPVRELFLAQDGTEYEVLALGSLTSQTLKYKIDKGIWYDNAICTYVPCVTYSDSELGDIVRINIDNHLIEFQVVGIISKMSNILKFTSASNNPILEHLFEKNGYDNQYPLIMFNVEDLPLDINILPDSNAIVYFNSNDSEAIENITKEFRGFAWFEPVAAARMQSENQLSIHIKTLAPIIISIFLVGLVSILCLTILNSMRYIRMISIYFICGMNWQMHIITCLVNTMYQLFCVSLIIGGLARINKSENLMFVDGLIFNNINVVGILLIYAIIIIASLITQVVMNKRETPIRYIKESW